MPVVDRGRVVAALPGYAVGDELGAGTSGLVLLGRHLDLDREVAIKVLSATSTGVAAGIDFRVEARLLSRLEHPHIVRIYDYVGQGDLCLLVMELLGGGTMN
nr:protein kinase [Micromonospora sp. DSM 115978]